ncbi:hypothetical protein BH24GEM1_BH24GEM1_28210 [soil metagenome]
MPLIVYHRLGHDYPWSSDRLHTFMVESATDLSSEFAERGIQHAFHLERDWNEAAERAARGGEEVHCPGTPISLSCRS